MTRAAGSPGTAGDGYRALRVPDKPPGAPTGLSGPRTGHPGQTVTTTTHTDTEEGT